MSKYSVLVELIIYLIFGSTPTRLNRGNVLPFGMQDLKGESAQEGAQHEQATSPRDQALVGSSVGCMPCLIPGLLKDGCDLSALKLCAEMVYRGRSRLTRQPGNQPYQNFTSIFLASDSNYSNHLIYMFIYYDSVILYQQSAPD